jgi:hypothetical protein
MALMSGEDLPVVSGVVAETRKFVTAAECANRFRGGSSLALLE